ncbi:ATP-binding protein [Streptomyces sp. NBC_01571]|uniref:sensor histidine kinase n=1 Tax=Streptomyces sp. NBC_01571 TaxID=2975883 RepID=UPI002250E5E2|nr:ATP-binding protein [Streptomyces sp. NBC_01571]MCX4575784.1 ATP-binding protein [Streptomyces sp. NBC_01571]
MTAPSPSGERPTLRATAPAPLLTAALAALAVVGAVATAPNSARVPVAWVTGTAAVLLCVAVAVATRAVRTAQLARRRLDTVSQDAGRLLQERARQAEEFNQERTRLTAESARDRTRAADAEARERARLTAEFEAERQRLGAEIAEERRRSAELTADGARLVQQVRQATSDRAAAISATANAAGRMQALSTAMLADLRAMEEKHSDEEVLADLLHLDHRTAQAGRLADSVAVLAGARSGRRWARPIVMESILRGAMGRIGGYQRVRLHSSSDAAVAGHAAEGVMHALAELLDNAANFSPPTAEVHVYVEEVPAGVIVSVEDSGLVMGDVQLRRAERAVSGDGAELGGLTGTRLGLAVVGRLARKHGLKVSFRPSARGGTGVLVLIPQDLLSLPSAPAPAAPEATPAAAPAPAPAPVPAEDVTAAAEDHPAAGPAPRASYAAARATGDLDPDPVPTHDSPRHADAEPAAGSLPKRRRGRTLEHAERSRARLADQAAESEPRTTDSKVTAARFSSFRQAVRGTAPDQAAVQGTVPEDSVRAPAYTPENAVRDEAAVRDTNPPHPEGDTTS